jgi:DNA-binding protein YbaB
MDINKLFGQLGNMKSELEKMTSHSKKDLEKAHHCGKSGDDGVEVEVIINGNKDIQRIKFSDGIKEYIKEDPDGFWDILADLIITAFKKASKDIEHSDSSDFGSMDDIMKNAQSMLSGMGGGIGDIEKLLGSVGGGFNKKKK